MSHLYFSGVRNYNILALYTIKERDGSDTIVPANNSCSFLGGWGVRTQDICLRFLTMEVRLLSQASR
jgi:hypothetical protein